MKTHLYRSKSIRWVLVGLFLLVLGLGSGLSFFLSAQAAAGLSVEVIAAPNLVVDSNVLSPSSYQPIVATVIGKFCNTSGTALDNVVGYIGDYDQTMPANSTPGDYPDSANNPSIGSTNYQGVYEFTHLGGTADAAREIGTLQSGECNYQYWSFTYPKTAVDNDTGFTIPAWGNSVKPEDDLWLEFDIWGDYATAPDDPTWVTHRMTLRNEISALANKIEPNGNPGGRWFNTDTSMIYPGETVVTNGILYRLGNVNKGFDNDSDGVPDYNAWLQPFGDPAYDPSCFRLISTTGTVTVTTNTGDVIIPFKDNLYFTNLPMNNTNVVGVVYYEFLALGGACTIPITPYQEVASGSDNEKFNGDYGAGPAPVGSYEPEVDITKSGPGTTGTDVAFTYNIPFANNSTMASAGLTLSSGGSVDMPLVVEDSIPEGLEFVCDSATTTLTGSNTAAIFFSTDSGTTWSASQPVSCPGTNPTSTGPNSLIMLRWILGNPLPASPTDGSTGNIAAFQALVPSTGYTGSNIFENCAEGKFGTNSPAFTEGCDVTIVQGTGSIGDFVWQDDDGDGVVDSGETGISSVRVWLYWDRNNDDELDADDILIATQDTSGTSEPNYDFTNLPAAEYLVKVDKLDPDIDTVVQGYTLTTVEVYDISLADGQDYNDADFGFGPTLELNKTLLSADPAYQNEEVAFQILLRNTLPGDGTANGFCTYSLYPNVINPSQTNTDPAPPSSGSGNSAWQNDTNALGSPDNLYAATNLNDNADDIGLGGFVTSGKTGNITSAKVLMYFKEIGEMGANDDVEVQVFRNDVSYQSQAYEDGTIHFDKPVGSTYLKEFTVNAPVGGWLWSDFDLQTNNTQGSVMELHIIGNGTGGVRGDVGLDAVAYVVTTDQQCSGADETIDPLPMTDTFDNSALEFVSAEPAESSVSGGTIHWSNLGPLYPGGTRVITVTYKALANSGSTINTATVDNAVFVTGRNTNDVSDNDSVDFSDDGTIAGNIWAENDTNTSWNDPTGYDAADTHITHGNVNLFACITSLTEALIIDDGNMSSCAGEAGKWKQVGSIITDENGDYLFEGLRPGFYNVKIDTNSLPTGFTANTAEPYPDSASPGGAECGTVTCDDQWFAEDTDLDDLNQLISGENITNVSFGYENTGTDGAVTGYVWYDGDSSGDFDTTEPGIPGVPVYLCAWDAVLCDSGNNSQETTTDATGYYSFTASSGSNYIVVVDQPGGSTQTGDPDVSPPACSGVDCDNTKVSFPIIQDEVAGPYNFGYVGTLTIGDTVYVDWNGDGTEDSGEEGISGVNIELYLDTDQDGDLEASDFLMDTRTTDANGNYTFSNLPGSGTMYIVNLNASTAPANHTLTADPSESGGTCIVCDGVYAVSLSSTNVDNADFGYQPTGYSSIGDYVWEDANGDGVQGANEAGIDGVIVYLYEDFDGNGSIDLGVDALISATVTTGNGLYTFNGLPEDNYIVQIDPTNFNSGSILDGYILTTTGDPPYDTIQVSYEVALGANQVFEDADFGFATTQLGDTVWQDNNGDGIRDVNEPGINGVSMQLYIDSNNNGQLDAGDQFVTSVETATIDGEDGKYFFTGVPAGNYIINVDPNELTSGDLVGFVLSGDPDVYNDLNPDSVSCLTAGAQDCDGYKPYDRYDGSSQYDENPAILPGSIELTADFGYQPLNTIGETVWIDSDGDGVRDRVANGDSADEQGIGYVDVNLCSTPVAALPCDPGDSEFVAQTQTDEDGYYSFGNLVDGSYTVSVDSSGFPVPLVQTFDPDVANPCNGVACDNTGTTSPLGAGNRSDMTMNFGYRYFGDNLINGTVWYDTNEDETIPPLPGEPQRYVNVTVYLWNCGADGVCGGGNSDDDVLVGSTQTADDGTYSFPELANGTYQVVVNDGAYNLQGTSPTTPTSYTGINLTGGLTETRNFGFVSQADMGDLPSSYNITLMGVNGPRHIIPTTGDVYLGSSSADPDPDGQESADAGATISPANGDDNDGNDDDEGVIQTPARDWFNGANGASVTITGVSSNCTVAVPCLLSAWVDWDEGGSFSSSERVLVDFVVTTGTTEVTFDVPGGTFDGATTHTFNARFRLYRYTTGGTAQPTGAVENGEVEDHQWIFGPTAVTLAGFSADPGGQPIWVIGLAAIVFLLASGSLFLIRRKRNFVPIQKKG